MMAQTAALLIVLALVVYADWVSSYPYEYITGEWDLHVGNGGKDEYVDCSTMGITREVRRVNLMYPDLVVDEYGNRGHWTTVSGYGAEIKVHGRSYIAFFKGQTVHEDNTTTYVSDSYPGWTHEDEGHDWACFEAHKVIPNTEPIPDGVAADVSDLDHDLDQMYEHDPGFIEQINAAQDLWTAGAYPEYETMTLREMRMLGGWRLAEPGKAKIAKATRELKDRAARLPEEFDWRDVDSVNYVGDVRNQGRCGSCYSFATAGMCEARLRVHTKNHIKVTLSPQDIVDCSPYSSGCRGAVTYLVVGPYTEDFGMVEESCNPYRANVTGICETDKTCRRHYFTGHHYVGGYYGASNEEAMRLSLVENGPVAVSFFVTSELFHYQGGIFQETGLTRKFDPFLRTNHAVLLVGYGVDRTNGTKFWSVKNSWGTEWGEEGYFRIVRGTNELNIESKASETFPIF